MKLQNFINGSFSAPLSGEYIDNFEPATGEVYSFVPSSQAEDVEQAVAAAKAAFPKWSRTVAQERSKILYRIADLIDQKHDALAQAESKDQGKPVKLAKLVDIPRASANFRFFGGAILHHEEMSTMIDGVAVNYTVRSPIGVIGLISPWNLPLYLLTWKIAPAIAVGNTCVCKPSEMTSMTAFMLGEILNQAGLPPGVVNIVFGLGPKVGEAIVKHPEISAISFTGGTVTGEHIAKASAPFCKKLSLELGGKNANIVFEDANLEDCVATSVKSAFLNQGEICLCGSRIFVQESIYDAFLAKFVELTKKFVVGDPNDEKTDMGALISEAHLQKIEYYVDLAKKEGGTIAFGGSRPNIEGRNGKLRSGYFYSPTIITGVDYKCRVVQEEIFGPVVTIAKFKTEEDALEMANCAEYGLSSTVWTENARRSHRMALGLNVGTVWVNCWMLRDIRVPFGGTKKSGIGREGGDHSIDFYTEQKTICCKFT